MGEPRPQPVPPPLPAAADAAPVAGSEGTPPDDRAIRLRMRLQGILDALRILEGVAPGDDLLGPIRLACDALAPRATGPVIPIFRRPLPDDLDAFERDLGRVEQAILAADATIPMLLFRRRFDARDLPRPALGRYAALLASNLGTDPERRDRVEMLVTRMVTVEGPDGRVRLEERSRVWSLLRQVSAGHRMSPAERSKALRFFAEQGGRLDGFRSAEEIFEGGFYANAYGYKLSLREGFLDPQVLYAAAWLNAAITNFNRAHSPRSEAMIHARAKALRTEVHGVFDTGRRLARASTTQRFEVFREKARAKARKARTGEVTLAARAGRTVPWRGILRALSVVAIVAGTGVLVRQYRATHRFHAIPEAQAETMAPFIAHASLGQGGTVLLGSVDPAAWAKLDPAARRRGAASLARVLDGRGTFAAFLTSKGHLVLQIDGGRVVYVQ